MEHRTVQSVLASLAPFQLTHDLMARAKEQPVASTSPNTSPPASPPGHGPFVHARPTFATTTSQPQPQPQTRAIASLPSQVTSKERLLTGWTPPGGAADKLFWCWVAAHRGPGFVETTAHTVVTEQQLKLEYADQLLRAKHAPTTWGKARDVAPSHDRPIRVDTILALAALHDVSLAIVSHRAWAAHMRTNHDNDAEDDNADTVAVIHLWPSPPMLSEYSHADVDAQLRAYLVPVHSFPRKLGAIGKYNMSDLVDLCRRANLPVLHGVSLKPLSKPELYGQLSTYLESVFP